MERLVEKGVNYIDTARGYTVSESYLGEALSGGLREKFILATKSMSRGYADMARDIGISLSNLRTDYIDLYQLHNIKSDADFELAFSAEGAVAAIQDAIRAGQGRTSRRNSSLGGQLRAAALLSGDRDHHVPI